MNLPFARVLIALGAAILLIVMMAGCGLQLGKAPDLSQVEPDYVDPPWYDDFKMDRKAAYDRFDDKVIQIEMRILRSDESEAGTEVNGATGFQELYRASCLFSQEASANLKGINPGRVITVKGRFSHMQELANGYKIYLKHCVLVSG